MASTVDVASGAFETHKPVNYEDHAIHSGN